jgi:hypothetical protein
MAAQHIARVGLLELLTSTVDGYQARCAQVGRGRGRALRCAAPRGAPSRIPVPARPAPSPSPSCSSRVLSQLAAHAPPPPHHPCAPRRRARSRTR